MEAAHEGAAAKAQPWAIGATNSVIAPPKRQIIQIATTDHAPEVGCEYTLFALCNDGTLFGCTNRTLGDWVRVDDIPQK